MRAGNKPSRRHSSVRGEAGSFLRPAQPSGRRGAQRRSRAAAGRRLRLALDGCEHGGITHPRSGRSALAKGANPMDLVTLVTACALAVDPKLMHALVWHQSGGEPWAVSVQGEPSPRVYSSLDEAIRETRAELHCRRRTCGSRRAFGITIESRSIRPAAMPQRRDGSRSDRQARQSLQGASASQSRSDLLRGCGLSRLMGAAGSQIRDRHRDVGCQG